MLNDNFKKVFSLILCIMLMLTFASCFAGNSNNNYGENIDSIKEQNSIVIYFSRTNNTEIIANYIEEITNSDKYEISAKVPYTDDDINYNDSNSRANQEQNDNSARPEIGSETIDLSSYDVIYLGYPIWWGQAPKIMYSFVESYDLTGKIIVPFCTSASSDIGTSATNLEKSTSGAYWITGKRFSASATKNDVANWLNSLNFGGK